MLAKVTSCALLGLEGSIITVEADISPGLPSFTIVGLPDAAVSEARERVRAAIRNSGFEFPIRKIVVNLAPADIKKAGPSYDLPIAAAILLSSGVIKTNPIHSTLLGELSLNGELRHTNGVLPMTAVAKRHSYKKVFVPACNASEASLVEGIEVVPCKTLKEVVSFLNGDCSVPVFIKEKAKTCSAAVREGNCFSDIKGQEHVKRALEVAASGGHNIVMCGPLGSGKTMLARALTGILPEMSNEEALEVTTIYSISGMLPKDTPMVSERPFRAPHYSISSAGLVGGGQMPRPGEISLSHRGVLFLDELPEFGRSLLELLRQPLEDRHVTISRANGSISYPSKFMLVGAMNPCPCGYYGDSAKRCSCAMSAISRYQQRISGPFLDRVDIFIEVPRVKYENLSSKSNLETSASVRKRVAKAREAQTKRFQNASAVCNAEMSASEIKTLCPLEKEAESLIKTAMNQLHLSARSYHRIIKLARTIADLEQSDIIKANHIAEAIQYRPRQYT